MYNWGIAPTLVFNILSSLFYSLIVTKAGRNVTFCNKNGQVFSEDYCPFHYTYFKTTPWRVSIHSWTGCVYTQINFLVDIAPTRNSDVQLLD